MARAATKAPAKKAPAKKVTKKVVKKAPAKKAPAKKAPAKKAPAKKAPAKKTKAGARKTKKWYLSLCSFNSTLRFRLKIVNSNSIFFSFPLSLLFPSIYRI